MPSSIVRGAVCPLPRNLLASAIGAVGLSCAGVGHADYLEPPITVIGVRGAETDSLEFTAPLLDTPKSVTVVPAALIEARAAHSLVEALRNVPGVTFNAGEGGQPAGDNLKIRGFDAGADVFIDGIRDAGSQTRDVFALERVEVVKGPGSAYAGRGAAGGTVNLVSKHPSLDDAVSGTVAGGTDDYWRATVDGNLQVGDSSALRLNLLTHQGDVAGRDAVDYDHKGMLAAASFGLATPWRAELDYYLYRTDDMPDYSFPYGRNADNTAPAGPPIVADRENFYGLVDRDFQKTSADVGTLRLEHDLGERVLLRNTTRVGRTSNDYVVTNPDDGRANVPNGFVLRNAKSRNSETETFGNQTELAWGFEAFGLRHDLATGVEYLREKMFNQNYVVSSGAFAENAAADPTASCSAAGAVGAASDFNCTTLAQPDPHDPWRGTIERSERLTDARAQTLSAYLFDTIELSERWLLNAGLRFDDFDLDQRTEADILAEDSSFWNYQLGVVFKPRPNGSIYVSSGSASTPPGNTLGDGTENLAANNVGLAPERSRTVELGTKWLLADERVSLNVALFHSEKNNASVALEPGRGAPRDSIGEQHVNGFEVGAVGTLFERWQLTASYTCLDSEIDDDGPADADEGNAFPNTPKHSLSLWTTYAVTPRLNLGAGAQYVDRRYGNTANTVWIPSYWRFDAMAAFRATDTVSVQLNVQNLTDEVYFDRPYAAHYAAVGAARSATLTLTFDL